ncbi:MAG: C40 family peptidase [Rhodobacteraceae bacterium]|nr:C40 family peptidase [Paracoccaceae bacterium]
MQTTLQTKKTRKQARMQIAWPVVDVADAPEGPRQRQFLFGESVAVQQARDGWARVQGEKDGYCGYVAQASLTPWTKATHYVAAPATHVYQAADLRAQAHLRLSFGSRLAVSAQEGRYARCAQGFVPRGHLRPLPFAWAEPAAVAELFLGTPYLWGGNSRDGVDCSGLVQLALLACALECPADSGPQRQCLGTTMAEDAPLKRNDLLFWQGHVAIVADSRRLVHANAHSMSVVREPISEAGARIAQQGEGQVIRRTRLPLGKETP